ncbi:MAG: hypothetical protein GAK45_01562 [Pseudomonas citronellolis]|nr:MAG: hypothetical protein GAK45_01562 [Pseudomonas citronellolis]
MTDMRSDFTFTRALGRLPPGIWALGVVSLLMDLSNELIHSLLPLFMVTTLGASPMAVGVIEGVAAAGALLLTLGSGLLSDWLRRRKLLVMIGYALGVLCKPVFPFSTGLGLVFAARIVDRIGLSVRDTPRDALLADLTPAPLRGTAFSLRQSLVGLGACGGPLLAAGLMWLWSDDFRSVFWVAMVPGLFAMLLLIFGVEEPAPLPPREGPRNPLARANLRRLRRPFWWVLGIGVLFALARFSEAFLVLRAHGLGLALSLVPLVMVLMNLVFGLSAAPFGWLSDRIGRYGLLALGLLVLVAADVLLGLSQDWRLAMVGVALWGLHMGMTQGVLAALLADQAPAELRGTAFGLFNLGIGIATLLASVLAGVVWAHFGAANAFYVGAGLAALALLALLLPRLRRSA